tara:strand:- start:1855 stop:2217 length:363 start_codon:yes stop_codon:yes gene_type:complete
MTYIPDRISRKELLSLQVNAEPGFVPAETTAKSKVELDVYIDALIQTLQEDQPGPVAAKALALRLVSQLRSWHEFIADKRFEEKDISCLTWAGDEKLLHMAWSCLEKVDLDDVHDEYPLP